MRTNSEISNFITNNPSKGSKVLRTIQTQLNNSNEFAICVAFITESGLTVLLNQLHDAGERGAKGRIITSTYQFFNHPKMFRRILQFENIEVRVYEKENLHTKGYFFTGVDEEVVVVGSSNLTASALTENREWNLLLSSKNSESKQTMIDANAEFESLWEDSTILTDAWIDTYSDKFVQLPKRDLFINLASNHKRVLPNKMQEIALRKIAQLRESGERRGLVISATGTGKTYLSAFDVRNFGAKKALFIIHREQIARDAMNTFSKVMPNKKMGLLSGNSKQIDSDIIFSTIQTLSKDNILNLFEADEFDYIVFDEAHRSASTSYLKVMKYFNPDFMMGMTATPERTDDLNVFELFDHNIAYEIRLNDALDENMLTPFHYFGVSEVQIDGIDIDDQTSISNLVSKHRVDYLLEKINYYGFSGETLNGLIFCSRNEEAYKLSIELNKTGLRTVALSGSDSQEFRELQIQRLTTLNELDFILTVDIFNEGIDIPEINQIVMLRPTQSAIVFVQQLGRGLRKTPNKDYVVVIDFIGNYKNNFLIPLALSGDRSYDKNTIRKFIIEGNDTMPGTSTIEFDQITKERIYEAINRTNFSSISYLKKEYDLLKYRINRIPSLSDYEENNILEPQVIFSANSINNHCEFLSKVDKSFSANLSELENKLLSLVSKEFSNGKRSVELSILRKLIDNQSIDMTTLLEEFSLLSIQSALNYLRLDFMTEPEQKKYEGLRVFESGDRQVYRSTQLENMLDNDDFVYHLIDVLEYGLRRNKTKFTSNKDGPMVLFEQYSRKDYCWLNNWDKNNAGTIYGYLHNKKTNTLPIFVTYKKDESISESIKYDDRFIDSETFNWMSKNNRTLNSNEIKTIINYKDSNTLIQLFVKRSDGEDTQFYNLGQVDVIEYHQVTMESSGSDVPVVNFVLKLKNPVRDDLYYYITD